MFYRVRKRRVGPRLAAAGMVGPLLALAAPPVLAFSDSTIITYAGTGQPGYSGDGGQAAAARLHQPSGVVLDSAANVFIADTANNRVRKVQPGGVITTVAGTGDAGRGGDGGQAIDALLDHPTGLAVDRSGTLYIADTGNNLVRRVTAQGVISTIAGGDGNRNCHTDHTVTSATPLPANSAEFCEPTGLAVDASGDLLIADTGHNVIRVLRPGASLTTFAGTGDAGLSGNTGAATSARLRRPTGVAVSGSTVLIADTGNSQLRKVVGGTITAVAGTGTAGFGGDGLQATDAELDHPTGVAFDPLGNVYVVDGHNRRVRLISASGVITTVAGTGRSGDSGDGGASELARLRPLGTPLAGVSADAVNMFFGDTRNDRARRVHKDAPPPALSEAASAVLLGASGAGVLGAGAYVLARRRRHSRVGPR